VSGLVIFMAVMRRSDTVGVRGEIVKLGGSLVPVVSAQPAMVASISSVAHESLLYEIKLNNTMPISLPQVPHSDKRISLARIVHGQKPSSGNVPVNS
jgi:hypothetical protein